jgi:hypothetical protein
VAGPGAIRIGIQTPFLVGVEVTRLKPEFEFVGIEVTRFEVCVCFSRTPYVVSYKFRVEASGDEIAGNDVRSL